jgi:hypothetical protein
VHLLVPDGSVTNRFAASAHLCQVLHPEVLNAPSLLLIVTVVGPPKLPLVMIAAKIRVLSRGGPRNQPGSGDGTTH